MIPFPELFRASERSDQVYRDDTQRRPILRGGHIGIIKGWYGLFNRESGDTSIQGTCRRTA